MVNRTHGDHELTRREEDLLSVLYSLGKASAAEIWEAMPDPPTYTAVRTHLTNLEEKGYVKYERIGRKYIYEPTIVRQERARQAIDELLSTYFENKVELVVATLINREESQITEAQFDELAAMIEKARRSGL